MLLSFCQNGFLGIRFCGALRRKRSRGVVLSVVEGEDREVCEADDAVSVYVCVGVPVGTAWSGSVGLCE